MGRKELMEHRLKKWSQGRGWITLKAVIQPNENRDQEVPASESNQV